MRKTHALSYALLYLGMAFSLSCAYMCSVPDQQEEITVFEDDLQVGGDFEVIGTISMNLPGKYSYDIGASEQSTVPPGMIATLKRKAQEMSADGIIITRRDFHIEARIIRIKNAETDG